MTMTEPFYSGRGYGAIRTGTYPAECYRYSRAQYFANIRDNGDLQPLGKSANYSESGIDWPHLENFLTEQVVDLKVIPIVGLWICNIDGSFEGALMLSEAGFTAFIQRLSNFLKTINGHVFLVPCWEFNQPSSIGFDPAYDWGLGVANSPRNWALQPAIYNSQMAMMRRVRDGLGINNITLVAAPEPRHVAYVYPGESKPWGGWDGPQGGRAYIEPFALGCREMDVIGVSLYINDQFMEDRAVMEDMLTVGWNQKIQQLIEADKPFFLWEYNTMPYPSVATPRFVELSYDIIANSLQPRYLLLSWWMPFSKAETTQRCNELACEYSGYVPLVYPCPTCGVTFASQAELDAHIASAHPSPPYTSTYIAYASGVTQKDIAVLRVFGHRYLPNRLIDFYDWCGPSLARLVKYQSFKNTVRKVIEWLVCQLKRNLTLWL